REVDRQTGYHTRCLLTVPLVGLEDQLVGVVQVLNKKTGVFTRYEEHLAEALAAQIGVVIQRARLLEHYVQKKQLESAMALARVNSLAAANLPECRLVTALLGVLDPPCHQLEYASAGHAPLFWYHADRRAVSSTMATGLPLGLIEPLAITSAPPVNLAPGDMG